MPATHKASAASPFTPEGGPTKTVLLHDDDSTGPGVGRQWMWSLARGLKQQGVASLNRFQIKAGEAWGDRLPELLAGAKLAVVMLSSAYIGSDERVRELQAAVSSGVTVVPVFLEEIGTDARFLGAAADRVQLADAFRAQVLDHRVPAPMLGLFQGADHAAFQRNIKSLATVANERTADHSFCMY